MFVVVQLETGVDRAGILWWAIGRVHCNTLVLTVQNTEFLAIQVYNLGCIHIDAYPRVTPILIISTSLIIQILIVASPIPLSITLHPANPRHIRILPHIILRQRLPNMFNNSRFLHLHLHLLPKLIAPALLLINTINHKFGSRTAKDLIEDRFSESLLVTQKQRVVYLHPVHPLDNNHRTISPDTLPDIDDHQFLDDLVLLLLISQKYRYFFALRQAHDFDQGLDQLVVELGHSDLLLNMKSWEGFPLYRTVDIIFPLCQRMHKRSLLNVIQYIFALVILENAATFYEFVEILLVFVTFEVGLQVGFYFDLLLGYEVFRQNLVEGRVYLRIIVLMDGEGSVDSNADDRTTVQHSLKVDRLHEFVAKIDRLCHDIAFQILGESSRHEYVCLGRREFLDVVHRSLDLVQFQLGPLAEHMFGQYCVLRPELVALGPDFG